MREEYEYMVTVKEEATIMGKLRFRISNGKTHKHLVRAEDSTRAMLDVERHYLLRGTAVTIKDVQQVNDLETLR